MLNTESVNYGLRTYMPTVMRAVYLLSFGAGQLIKNEMAITAIRTYSAFSMLNMVYADNTINLQSGLVAYYPFNGNTNDESGNQLHGTSYGATLTKDRFGKENGAYSFDGVSSYIKIGDPVPQLLRIQNEISLSAWMYVNSYPTFPSDVSVIVGCLYDVKLSGASIFVDSRANPGHPAPNGHIHFQIGDGNYHGSDANSQIPLNEWIHVVVTRRADDQAKFYYNGELQRSNGVLWSGSISYDGGRYAIGAQKDHEDRYFNGKIDEVRVYNRGLNSAEVFELYTQESSTLPNLQSGLVAYYPFNSNANDESGNGNNGIVYGAQLTRDRWGGENSAYYFNGINNFIQIYNSPILEIGKADYSFTAWINPAEEHTGRIWSKGSSDCITGYMLRTTTDLKLHLENSYDGTCMLSLDGNLGLKINNWNFIAVTVDRNVGGKVYINGILCSEQKINTSPYDLSNGRNPTIGSNDVGKYMEFFKGHIDELRLYNRLLTFNEISVLSNLPSPSLQSGLVAYYPFNGNANDASGNQLHGTSYGATLTKDRFGKENGAYSFDGVSSYIKIGDPVPELLRIQNSLSLSAWIYVNSYPAIPSAVSVIVGCLYDVKTSGASIFVDSRIDPGHPAPKGHIHFQIGDGNYHGSDANSQIPLNEWIHVVVTRRADDQAKFYYNGELQRSNGVLWPGSISYDGGRYAIGAQKDHEDRYFNGKIDEVRVYNRALNSAEVFELYTQESSMSFSSSPVESWPPKPSLTSPMLQFSISSVENSPIKSSETKSSLFFSPSPVNAWSLPSISQAAISPIKAPETKASPSPEKLDKEKNPSSQADVPLIAGLTVGLGVPALTAAICYYYYNKHRASGRHRPNADFAPHIPEPCVRVNEVNIYLGSSSQHQPPLQTHEQVNPVFLQEMTAAAVDTAGGYQPTARKPSSEQQATKPPSKERSKTPPNMRSPSPY